MTLPKVFVRRHQRSGTRSLQQKNRGQRRLSRPPGHILEYEPEDREPVNTFSFERIEGAKPDTADDAIRHVGRQYGINVDDLLYAFGPQPKEPTSTDPFAANLVRLQELARRVTPLGLDVYYSWTRFEVYLPPEARPTVSPYGRRRSDPRVFPRRLSFTPMATTTVGVD